MLRLIHAEYIPTLKRSADADVAAVAVVLESYISDHKYLKEPEGRAMPRVDVSSLRENRA